MKKDILWTITNMLCLPGQRDGYEFQIALSPELVQRAQVATINQIDRRDRFNELAIEMIVNNGGYPDLGKNWAMFGYHEQFGVNLIRHPAGDGRWLSIQYSKDSAEEGAKGVSHNIDTSGQMSLLLAVWVLYVSYLDI